MKKVAFFMGYFLIPFVAAEIFLQFRFSYGYAYDLYRSLSISGLDDASLRQPNQRRKYEVKTLYGNPGEIKKINYRTDKYGTIIPSSLEASEENISNSVLFCGGSTTESSKVDEGSRVPDIFTNYSGINAINAGVSGKSLSGCNNTVKFILENFGKPRTIFIANNVNTLPAAFSDPNTKSIAASISPKKVTLISKARDVFGHAFPGITFTRRYLAKLNEIDSPSNSGLTPYEEKLLSGCCHGPAMFNAKRENLSLDWYGLDAQIRYRSYVRSQINALNMNINIHDYPKRNVVFFMEPNSFLLPPNLPGIDYKQYLTGVDGIRMNGSQSAKITEIYDNIYREVVESNGYSVIAIETQELKPSYFYDATHLTPDGTGFVGEFYSLFFKRK